MVRWAAAECSEDVSLHTAVMERTSLATALISFQPGMFECLL